MQGKNTNFFQQKHTKEENCVCGKNNKLTVKVMKTKGIVKRTCARYH